MDHGEGAAIGVYIYDMIYCWDRSGERLSRVEDSIQVSINTNSYFRPDEEIIDIVASDLKGNEWSGKGMACNMLSYPNKLLLFFFTCLNYTTTKKDLIFCFCFPLPPFPTPLTPPLSSPLLTLLPPQSEH